MFPNWQTDAEGEKRKKYDKEHGNVNLDSDVCCNYL